MGRLKGLQLHGLPLAAAAAAGLTAAFGVIRFGLPATVRDTAVVRCELPEPTVLRREGNSVLQVWELPADAVWFGNTVPDAAGYLTYRAAIRQAGGDRARPVADPPQPKNDADRELWRREDHNAALMYEAGGKVAVTIASSSTSPRAIRCSRPSISTGWRRCQPT